MLAFRAWPVRHNPLFMKVSLLPPDEHFRLQDLYAHNILDTEEDNEFSELLELVASICQCPLAAISFIDKERQWYKARRGIAEAETSREDSFCTYTILSDKLLIVEDTRLDARFQNNPFVTPKEGVRFYAGSPIVSQSGYHLGAVCVLDKRPRNLTGEQTKILRLVSQQISRLLHLRLQNAVLKQRAEECLLMEKQLVQRTLREQEEERRVISTELHENIAQTIAATKIYLELANGPATTRHDWIEKSKENLNGLLQQVRELSKSLVPTTLADFSLKEILETLVARFNQDKQLQVTFIYEGSADIEPSMAICLYRVVEEHLQQVKKEGCATEVVLNVNACHAVFLSIKDNNRSFDVKRLKDEAGLNRILSRVESFNGSVDISAERSGGCRLTLRMPLGKPLRAGDYLS